MDFAVAVRAAEAVAVAVVVAVAPAVGNAAGAFAVGASPDGDPELQPECSDNASMHMPASNIDAMPWLLKVKRPDISFLDGLLEFVMMETSSRDQWQRAAPTSPRIAGCCASGGSAYVTRFQERKRDRSCRALVIAFQTFGAGVRR